MNGYIQITNKDKKTWVLPCKHIRTALCLYQPSSVKGKMLKKVLPLVIPIPFIPERIYYRIGIKKTEQTISDELFLFLQNLFLEEKNIQISAFMGTPGIHKKVTLQISSGRNILGYCKVTENAEIYELFKNEQMILQALAEKGINNIPKCLYCGELGNRKFIFVQSTIKTIHSYSHHSIGPMEVDFLQHLSNATKTEIHFENTDFFQSIQMLQKHLYVLEKNSLPIEVIKQAHENVTIFYQKKRLFSAIHRDFTPWNTFIEKDSLFVFDFEYAALTYPANLDAIHYLVQNAIFEKKKALEIYQCYKTECKDGVLKGVFEFPSIALQAYLVDIISLYILREQDEIIHDDIKNMLNMWIEICKYAIADSCTS